ELLGQQRGGNIYIIPIVGAIIAVDAITSIQFAQLRERADVGRFMKIKIVGVVTNFALCIGFYSLLPYIESKGINCTLWNENFGVGYVFVSNLCASLIAMIMLSKRCSNFRFKVDKKVLKAVMVFSIPIFIGGLAGTSNDFIDRQLLYFILPEGEATQQMGIYSAVMKLGAFIYLFTQMYRYAAEPYFLSEVKESDFLQRNAEALKYFTIASLAIFLFITLFIDYFQYFIGEDFRSGIKITPIILITNVLFGVYINLSYWYKIKEKSMIAIYISLSGLIVTIILNIILVPKFGYVGSAIGRLACFLTMVIIGYILNQKYMKTPYDIKSLAKYFMLTILLLALFNILNFEGLVVKTMFSIIFFAIFVAYFSYQESIFKRLKRKQ
ncbi:MAG: oligosaccharide flippase family protein, partial [Rikenellaceae bacterium]